MSNQVDSKIYQFIAKHGGLEAVDANKNGNISYGELTSFLKDLNLDEFGNKNDLISGFFQRFDSNVQNGNISGSNDRNYGTLDKDEQKALEAKIKKYGDFNNFLQTKVYAKFPAFLGSDKKNSWCNSVESQLQSLFDNFNGDNFATLENQWNSNGTVNKAINQATAKLYTSSLTDVTYSMISSLNLNDDQKKQVKSELESFLSKYTSKINANTKLEDIQKEMDAIVATYLEKSGITLNGNLKGKASDEIAKKYGIADSDDKALNTLQILVIANRYGNVLTNFLQNDEKYKQYIQLGGDPSLINVTNFFNNYCKNLKNSNFGSLSEEALKTAFQNDNEYKKISRGIEVYQQAPAKIQTAIAADESLKVIGYETLKEKEVYKTTFKQAVEAYINGTISLDNIVTSVINALKSSISDFIDDGTLENVNINSTALTGPEDNYNKGVNNANGDKDAIIEAAFRYINKLRSYHFQAYKDIIREVFGWNKWRILCQAMKRNALKDDLGKFSVEELQAKMQELITKINNLQEGPEFIENESKYRNTIALAPNDLKVAQKAALTYVQTVLDKKYTRYNDAVKAVFQCQADMTSVTKTLNNLTSVDEVKSKMNDLISRINAIGDVPGPTLTLEQDTYTMETTKPVALKYSVKYNNEGEHKLTFESENPKVKIDEKGNMTVWDASEPKFNGVIRVYDNGKLVASFIVTFNVISTEEKEKYQKASSCINNIKPDVIGYGKKEIHTEFGIDRDGSIMFQEDETTTIYNKLCEEFKQQLRDAGIPYDDDIYKNADWIVQAAWIMSYNSYNSSTRNNTVNFLNTTLSNMKKILNKLLTNPEYLDVITGHTSYADSTLTKDLPHYGKNTTYGGDQTLDYRGGYTTTSDGNVHLTNTYDDPDYQKTMSELLKRLKNKYSNTIDAKTIESIFRQAQKKALDICKNNTYDCPHGTGRGGNGNLNKEDNWKNHDNRSGDKGYIDVNELVELTLYCFDKLLYKELFN